MRTDPVLIRSLLGQVQGLSAETADRLSARVSAAPPHRQRPDPAAKPIERLAIPHATLCALRRIGVTTAGELARLGEYQLSRRSGIGPKSLSRVRESLARLGLTLSE